MEHEFKLSLYVFLLYNLIKFNNKLILGKMNVQSSISFRLFFVGYGKYRSILQ